MIDYDKWADEYEESARKIQQIIQKEKKRLLKTKLTADRKKARSNALLQYRAIYRELIRTAHVLRQRQRCHHEN